MINRIKYFWFTLVEDFICKWHYYTLCKIGKHAVCTDITTNTKFCYYCAEEID